MYLLKTKYITMMSMKPSTKIVKLMGQGLSTLAGLIWPYKNVFYIRKSLARNDKLNAWLHV